MCCPMSCRHVLSDVLFTRRPWGVSFFFSIYGPLAPCVCAIPAHCWRRHHADSPVNTKSAKQCAHIGNCSGGGGTRTENVYTLSLRRRTVASELCPCSVATAASSIIFSMRFSGQVTKTGDHCCPPTILVGEGVWYWARECSPDGSLHSGRPVDVQWTSQWTSSGRHSGRPRLLGFCTNLIFSNSKSTYIFLSFKYSIARKP